MPLFVALAGDPPYPPLERGPFYVPMYPPLSVFFYSPVALFRHTAGVLRSGAALAVSAVLLPFLLALRASGASRRALPALAAALCCFVFLIHTWYLLIPAVYVHADAPALLVVGLGAVALARASGSGGDRFLLASSAVLSLAPWTKQTLAPAVLLPALLLFVRGSRRKAFLHLGIAVLLQLLWTALFAALFGGPALADWLVRFPALHPWSGPPLESLAQANRILVVETLAPAAFLASAWVWSRRKGPAWTGEPWAVFFVTAILLWPSSLIGYVKLGGALNSFLPAVYFTTCASLLLLFGSASSSDGGNAAGAVLLLVATVLGVQTAIDAAIATRGLARATNESDVVFKTLRKNPDAFLFPWYPLTTYLATGRFAHSELGFRERELAGLRLSDEEVRRYVPAGLRFIVCGKDPCDSTLSRFRVRAKRAFTEGDASFTVYEVARPGES
jgi:hypothetical protein